MAPILHIVVAAYPELIRPDLDFRIADNPGVGMNFVYNVALASAKATLARCIADEIAMTLT